MNWDLISENYAEKREKGADRRPDFWKGPGRGASVGDENQLPTVRETKTPGIKKDGAMPIHGKLFMDFTVQWASQKLIRYSVSARLFSF